MNSRVLWSVVSALLLAAGLFFLVYVSFYRYYVASEPVPLPTPLYVYRSSSGVLWFQLTQTQRCIGGTVVTVVNHAFSEVTVDGRHFKCKGNIARSTKP
jgi:hypothetical protein